jgi:hypothetical protein
MAYLLTAVRRIGRGTLSRLFEASFFAGLLIWDLSLNIVNLFTFKRKIGSVTPKGHPGEGGDWPEYISPAKRGQPLLVSRTQCYGQSRYVRRPMMEARGLAHMPRLQGIIKRDGRDISFKELSGSIRSTYNFSRRFVYSCHATSRTSWTALTALGASILRISMCTTASNMTPRWSVRSSLLLRSVSAESALLRP